MKFTKLLLAVLLSVSANLALADPVVQIRDPDDGSIVSVDGFLIVADVYGISQGDQITLIQVVVDGLEGDSRHGGVTIECGSMVQSGELPLRVLGNWRKRMCNPIQGPPKLVLIAEQGGQLQSGSEYIVGIVFWIEERLGRHDIVVTAQ
jgi:hypothetical protein